MDIDTIIIKNTPDSIPTGMAERVNVIRFVRVIFVTFASEF